jgi:hypothetical protein
MCTHKEILNAIPAAKALKTLDFMFLPNYPLHNIFHVTFFFVFSSPPYSRKVILGFARSYVS